MMSIALLLASTANNLDAAEPASQGTTASGTGEKAKPMPKAKPTQRQLLETFVKEFVDITPGKGKFPAHFEMGSKMGLKAEQPVHRVTFQKSFAMARYEVPQDLYLGVMGKNPSVWGGPRNSVEMVSWRDANDFCARATTLLREAKLIAADELIRLPTESEWEYCCRAGTTTEYSFGDKARNKDDEKNKASILDLYGWHTGNAAGNDPPVGAKKPNAWGLYDMHGYLWEFVADAWHPDYTDSPNEGSAWKENAEKQPKRVVRGGSWRDAYPLLRSANRTAVADDFRSDALGFRCVRSKK